MEEKSLAVDANILKVSQVNTMIKNLLDNNQHLNHIYVQGELSNYKVHPSGHHYFSLKDDSGTLRAVMFKGSARHLTFQPQNGMEVIVFGRISVFVRDGAYQMYAEKMVPSGAGALNVEFEKLKKKLDNAGLFDAAHKKKLPPRPQRVGVVTSGAGAALHDILRVTKARWPMAEIRVFPVRVQGENAGLGIARAIEYADRWQLADVLIVGRGGGSMEDLWCFNDERVAIAIYNANTPIISAVGHEPDVTISDYVADVRAATPSNGAEIAVPDQQAVRTHIKRIAQRINVAAKAKIAKEATQLVQTMSRTPFANPFSIVNNRSAEVDFYRDKLFSLIRNKFNQKQLLNFKTEHRIKTSSFITRLSKLRQSTDLILPNRLERATSNLIGIKRKKLEALTRRMERLDPDKRVKESRHRVAALTESMSHAMSLKITRLNESLSAAKIPHPSFAPKRACISLAQHTIASATARRVNVAKAKLAGSTSELKAMSPLNVLSRGYACVYNNSGTLLTTADRISKDDVIDVRLKDGVIQCNVIDIKPLSRDGAGILGDSIPERRAPE